MKPIREAGNSTLLMVLILLLLGVMMLAGLSSHLAAQRQWGIKETRSIVRYAGSQSALAWGERQHWLLQEGWQCKTMAASEQRACLSQIKGNEVLLAGFTADDNFFDQQILWRWGCLENGKFIAHAHGWLDYCPLSDKTRCNLAS